MVHDPSLHDFLASVPDRDLSRIADVRDLAEELLVHLEMGGYSVDDADDSIANLIASPPTDRRPSVAFQFGFDPEVDERGPRLPHRPSHVQYPTEEQILNNCSVEYVVGLTNATFSVVGESFARTIVFWDTDESLDKIPTYSHLNEGVVDDVLTELRSTGSRMRETSGDQSSLSEY